MADRHQEAKPDESMHSEKKPGSRFTRRGFLKGAGAGAVGDDGDSDRSFATTSAVPSSTAARRPPSRPYRFASSLLARLDRSRWCWTT